MRLLLLALLFVGSLVRTSLGLEYDIRLYPELSAALEDAQKVTLYSIYPHGFYRSAPLPKLKPGESFNGYRILGSTRLSGREQAVAVTAVKDAISAFDGKSSGRFEPRHALRVQTGSSVYDVLICFSCHSLKVFRGGDLISEIEISGTPDGLDGLLHAAGISLPLPQKPLSGRPRPVSARVAPVRWQTRASHETIGNIVVTFSDRHREIWTKGGGCLMPKVARSGLVGWTEGSGQHSRGGWMNSALAVARGGRVLGTFDGGLAFIEFWRFVHDDHAVVIGAMGAHGPTWLTKFAIETGLPMAETSGSQPQETAPEWAKPFVDDAQPWKHP